MARIILLLLVCFLILSSCSEADYADGKYTIMHRLSAEKQYKMELAFTGTIKNDNRPHLNSKRFFISSDAIGGKEINTLIIDSVVIETGSSEELITRRHGEFFDSLHIDINDLRSPDQKENLINKAARHMAMMYVKGQNRPYLPDSVHNEFTDNFTQDLALRRLINGLGPAIVSLPPGAVEVGDSWTNNLKIITHNLGRLTFNMKYSLHSVSSDRYEIEVSGELDNEADTGLLGLQPQIKNMKMTGTLSLFRMDAWPASGKLTMSCDFFQPAPDPIPGNPNIAKLPDVAGTYIYEISISGQCIGD